MKNLFLITLILILVSCEKPDGQCPYSPKVKVGDTPSDVVRKMGKPGAVSRNTNYLHKNRSDSLYYYLSPDSILTEVYYSDGFVNSISISSTDTCNVRKMKQHISENYTYFKETSNYTVFIDGDNPSSSKTAVLLFCPEGMAYASYYNIEDCEYTKEYIK